MLDQKRSTIAAIVYLGFALCFASFASPAVGEGRSGPVSHVIELFTSQGCSSCPPADAYVKHIREYPDTVVLSWHVDYWDYIGWKDSFAHASFTERQKQYARANSADSVYTPQFVHNGYEIIAGFKPEQVAMYLNTAATQRAVFSNSAEAISVAPLTHSGSLDVLRVWYSPKSTVSISNGENTGKKLTYYNTVRSVERLATWTGDAQLRIEVAKDKNDLNSVILIQDPKSMRILGAWRD